MIFLEINEFSPDLMAKAAELLNAKNLRRLLKLQHTQTTTDDKSERFGLDPWVQWVSIHTGKTSSQHGVGHLGDVPQLTKKGVRPIYLNTYLHFRIFLLYFVLVSHRAVNLCEPL